MKLYRIANYYITTNHTLEKHGATKVADELNLTDTDIGQSIDNHNASAKGYFSAYFKYCFFLISIYLVVIHKASGPSVLIPLTENIKQFAIYYIMGLAAINALMGMWGVNVSNRSKTIAGLIGEDENVKNKWALTHSMHIDPFLIYVKGIPSGFIQLITYLLLIINYLLMLLVVFVSLVFILIYVPFELVLFLFKNMDESSAWHWAIVVMSILGFLTPILDDIIRYMPTIVSDKTILKALVNAPKGDSEKEFEAVKELYNTPWYKKIKVGIPKDYKTKED